MLIYQFFFHFLLRLLTAYGAFEAMRFPGANVRWILLEISKFGESAMVFGFQPSRATFTRRRSGKAKARPTILLRFPLGRSKI